MTAGFSSSVFTLTARLLEEGGQALQDVPLGHDQDVENAFIDALDICSAAVGRESRALARFALIQAATEIGEVE